ncbi:MAG TPA: uroporphyrinogen-III synthase [Candidatus Bathyarchaeia archaeon]|nr:uroporphyrinogen-III synthase [Candidatus Bathyarchaeia archaeon]
MQTTTKPLLGKRIVVTRAARQAAILSKKLQDLGATTLEIPTIEIKPPSSTDPIDHAIRNLGNYDWIIFTSVHGVEWFMSRMAILKADLAVLDSVRVAAIGSATSATLERFGRSPDYVPDEFLSERIVRGLGDLQGKKILLPRADIASKKLPLLLRDRGATVVEVTAYRTASPDELNSEKLRMAFRAGRVDIVTFTSPSTLCNFVQAFGDVDVGKYLNNVRVACIGPVTFEAAKQAGIDVNVVANPHTIDALVEAIVDDIRNL